MPGGITVRENDPVLNKNLRLLHEINSHFHNRAFNTNELTEVANERDSYVLGDNKLKNPGLHQILSEFSGGRNVLNTIAIGKALRKVSDRVLEEMILTSTKRHGGQTYWTLKGGRAIQDDNVM